MTNNNQIQQLLMLENHSIIFVLESGEVRSFDIQPYLQLDVFKPLQNIEEFQRIHNGKYFVEWDCGADLSLDTLMAHSAVMNLNALTTSST